MKRHRREKKYVRFCARSLFAVQHTLDFTLERDRELQKGRVSSDSISVHLVGMGDLCMYTTRVVA
jgi:hypothetical protein